MRSPCINYDVNSKTYAEGKRTLVPRTSSSRTDHRLIVIVKWLFVFFIIFQDDFTIDATTGVVSVAKTLDRETTSIYTLVLTAEDQGTSNRNTR